MRPRDLSPQDGPPAPPSATLRRFMEPAAVTEDSVIHRTVIANGVTVVTEEMPRARSVAFAALTRQGSRDERRSENGLSHFLEHFVFRGTRPWARVPGGRTLRDVSIETDLLGGEMDAWTGRESTCYSAEVAAELFERAALLVCDMVARPSLPERDLERERSVIREEMRGYDEDPSERAFIHASRMWWPGHPLGRRVEGTPRSLAAFTLADVAGFWERKHAGANIVCCAAGRVTHEQVVALVAESLGALPPRAPRSGPPAGDPVRGIKLERRARLEQAQVVLSMPGLASSDESLSTLAILVTALGGGMSSRLWQRIREEEGLAYTLSLDHEGYRDCGRTQFHAVCAPENAARVLRLFREEADAVRGALLPDDEFARVTQGIRSGIVLGTESPADRLDDLYWSELVHRRPVTLDERLAKLARVTPDDVLRLAGRLLADPRRLLVVVSPDLAGLDESSLG